MDRFLLGLFFFLCAPLILIMMVIHAIFPERIVRMAEEIMDEL